MADQEGKKRDVKKIADQRIAKAMVAVAEDPNGQIVLQYIMQQCSFHTSTIVGDPVSHEINVYGTLFNEARRRLYLDIRRYIPNAIRRKIEN